MKKKLGKAEEGCGTLKPASEDIMIFELISQTSGAIIIIVDLFFSVWASLGKAWYFYILNFIILFLVSSMINTCYIQGLTRGYSFIYLYRAKGIGRAFSINIITLIYFVIAFLIVQFMFPRGLQVILYFAVCITLSTIVAIADRHFDVAIDRTREFERLKK